MQTAIHENRRQASALAIAAIDICSLPYLKEKVGHGATHKSTRVDFAFAAGRPRQCLDTQILPHSLSHLHILPDVGESMGFENLWERLEACRPLNNVLYL